MTTILKLREFRAKHDRLTDFLPYAAMIAPGIILNKDGSLQKSFRFRGPDLDSATQGELISITSQINNVLKRLTSGWAIFVEAKRTKSPYYPESKFPDNITFLIDKERQNMFSAGNHYENEYYFTLLYLPPEEKISRIETMFIKRVNQDESSVRETHLKEFQVEAGRIYSLFKETMPETIELTDAETLTYLHSCATLENNQLVFPEIPIYLDAIIATQSLVTGFEPILGKNHFRVISILGFPGSSTPGLLDNLNRLNFEYRWCSRLIPLDKVEAQKELERYRKLWFSKRESMKQMIRKMFTNEETMMLDNDAVSKADDADEALQEVSDDLVSYGFFTMTVIVWDTDANKANKKAEVVKKTIDAMGFTCINETMNAVEAWLGSLPGLTRANIRRPLLSSLNFAHIFPLSAVWAGQEKNHHLNAPALIHTQTPGFTPFRLNLHVGDVGHTMIVGPTGAGKSVHLAILAAQFRRYKNAQVYFFDKDASVRALTAGVGGDFYDLADEKEDSLSFQPFANIDNENERAWAAEWVYDYLRSENVEITPDVKKAVWTALGSLATSPREERTITGLTLLLQDNKIRQALEPITLNGAFGKLFDSTTDNLDYGRWQVFEMAQLMNTPTAVPPTLSYLFKKIEQRLDGSPTLLVLDECWLLLDNPIFAAKIREWLKVLRKFNTSVVFATQSLADIENSSIASAIMDACQTKIFLPNPNAREERMSKTYHSFGLNDREIEIISMAVPKKQYYYKSILGSRLYELALESFTLAYCAASSKESQIAVRDILAEKGKEGFNEAWLRFNNLHKEADWVAENPKAYLELGGM